MGERVILHCDCNSFYASVELLRHPELRGVPVAVAGSVDDRHGIILAKNDIAKKQGVQTAETLWQARHKCPGLQLLPPHHGEYRHFSKIINTIYAEYTDRVEPFGIDESWLDVTGSWQLFGASPKQVADILRAQVQRQTGISISVGLSFNKVFAKLGSDYKKPDATTEITRENYRKILWPLPVTSMLFVGKKAGEVLAGLGIATLGQLAVADEDLLRQLLGKAGAQMRLYAQGLDESQVACAGESETVKSVGNGLTFRRNLQGHQDVRTALGALAEEVAGRLRRKKLYAASLQVLIKDPGLKSITRQKALPFATNLAKDLTEAAMRLMDTHWDYAKPIRMLTLTAQQLTDLAFAGQISFFDETAAGPNPRQEKLEQSIDDIRGRFGKTAILKAGMLHNNLGLAPSATPGVPDEGIEEE